MKELLIQARHEIISLRKRNEVLEAQVGIVEIFAAALGLKHENRGASGDVAWLLEKKIDTLIMEEKTGLKSNG
jgi:hypothetical protein